jgi:hypothetical protein
MSETIKKTKTAEKIERETAKLANLTAKRDELTANYRTKLDEIEKNIKEQESVVANLKKQEKLETLDAVSLLLEKNGVSANDLLNAVTKGDFYGIQEILESGGKPATPAPEASVSEAVPAEEDNLADDVPDKYEEDTSTNAY